MIKKLLAFVSFIFFTLGVQALTVFDNTDACEIARKSSLAEPYVPTTKAPFKGGKGWTKHTVPAGGACLGEAHVLEDGAPRNGKAVFVEEGFVYWKHTSGAFRMNDCSNPFGQLVLLTKAEPAPASQAPTATVSVPAAPIVVETETRIKEKKILEVEFYCKMPDGREVRAAVQNGQPVCPTVSVTAPVVVQEPIGMQPRVVQAPQVPAPRPAAGGYVAPVPSQQAQAPCSDCHVEAHVTRVVPRTDGRCVLAMRDTQTGKTYEVWLGSVQRQGMTLLVATNMSNDRRTSLVGDGNVSTQMHTKDCHVARDAFLSQRRFAWTAGQIGLPLSCVPVQTARRE